MPELNFLFTVVYYPLSIAVLFCGHHLGVSREAEPVFEDMQMKRVLWAPLALMLGASGSYGQDRPRADVAFGYSHLEVLPGYTIGMDGGSASVAVQVNNWFGVAGDLGVYHGTPARV